MKKYTRISVESLATLGKLTEAQALTRIVTETRAAKAAYATVAKLILVLAAGYGNFRKKAVDLNDPEDAKVIKTRILSKTGIPESTYKNSLVFCRAFNEFVPTVIAEAEFDQLDYLDAVALRKVGMKAAQFCPNGVPNMDEIRHLADTGKTTAEVKAEEEAKERQAEAARQLAAQVPAAPDETTPETEEEPAETETAPEATPPAPPEVPAETTTTTTTTPAAPETPAAPPAPPAPIARHPQAMLADFKATLKALESIALEIVATADPSAIGGMIQAISATATTVADMGAEACQTPENQQVQAMQQAEAAKPSRKGRKSA